MQPKPQQILLSVSELNAEINLLLKKSLPLLWIEGEISNLAHPTSGHLYFSLKDSKAQVRCAMFRNHYLRSHCKAENGLKVQLQARVGLYQPRGEYQLIVEKMEKAGAGALKKAFEALKKQLFQQGLFAQEHKKSIPAFPKRIGIITSPSGAALQDIIHVLHRRCPHIPLLIYPVTVQGKQAVSSIINALQKANTNQQCDVLLLARGGGSIEDLQAFNEADIAHAIEQSDLPIITGIGHEIDVTIADFVSDQRAPTPSAAAELASSDKLTLQNKLQTFKQRLQCQSQKIITQKQEKSQWLSNALNAQNPMNQLKRQIQQLDELDIRLYRAFEQTKSKKTLQLQTFKQCLLTQSPQQNIEKQKQQQYILNLRLSNAMRQITKHHQQRLGTLNVKLQAISPLATLQRGYSIAQKKDHIIHSVKQLKKNDDIIVHLSDGEFHCKINNITKKKKTIV